MQKLIVVGNLGRDAEVKKINDQTQVINFAVAVTEKFTDKQGRTVEDTTWYDCQRFVKTDASTKIADYLTKGTKVLIEGKPKSRCWKKDGGSVDSVITVTVQNIQLLSVKERVEKTAEQIVSETEAQAANNVDSGSDDDDLPF